jgi:lysophospholipase L1-like esterase
MTVRIAFVGDSFTEGVGDERPGSSLADAPRGWADRVAEGLAATGDEPIFYANFAIRGRLLAPIATNQVDAALALDPAPDLLVINGGGNDMMRPDYSTARCAGLLEGVMDRAATAGVKVLVLSGPNPSDHLPMGNMFNRRGRELTDAIPPLVESREHVQFVSCFDDQELRDRRYWSPDRLHLNPLGHARVASIILTALGVATPEPEPGEPAPPRSARTELAYATHHLAPWVGRRLVGKSSGDGRSPKHAVWHQIAV